MKFVFAGGGTGGHVVPALAVAREIVERGHSAVFIGTKQGIEAKLVPPAGFPIHWIEIGGLNRVGWKKLLRSLWQLPASVFRCIRILDRERPHALFSMGGYVAGPALLAAVWRRIPVVAMEPNAMPGFVHRITARWVDRALLGIADAAPFFPADRSLVTGVPVRPEFFRVPPLPPPHDRNAPFTVLITGGSQGSRTLNRAFRQSWPLFSSAELRFIHQSGPADADSLARDFQQSGLTGTVTAFIAAMPTSFAQADLVIGRAGANAVAELAAAGKPSILIPFPFAADQHQAANARALENAGAAIHIPDSQFDGPRLHREVTALLHDPARLARMALAAKSLAKPQAAAQAASALEKAVKTVPVAVDTGAESRNN